VNALRCALEAIVDDADLRTRLGVRARDLALDKFDADKNDQRIVDLVAAIGRPVQQRRVA
jgi:hypothetical protein